MKRLINNCSIVILFFLLFSCNDNEVIKIKVLEEIIDIGNVKKSGKSIAKFKIVNLGNKELIIKNILTDCHCTVPDWSDFPIKKGDTISINITYDNNVLGFFEQTATLYLKGSSVSPLLIMRGTVIE